MPHAVQVPPTGLQALILCGPGMSLTTFTSQPEDYPKALLPIANRPMIWYALDWCYRMGLTSIHLVTPPSAARAIETALAQNPFLTSLPTPKPVVISPAALTQTSGTAELLRLQEVRDAIQRDFLVLPCDIVCDLPAESVLELWLAHGDQVHQKNHPSSTSQAIGDFLNVRGPLGVWYDTQGELNSKGEETDLIITSNLDAQMTPTSVDGSSLPVSRLLYTVTKETLKDLVEDQKMFPVRYGLLRKNGAVKVRKSLRAAHIYFFAFETLELVAKTNAMDSISEDLIGNWAKAAWQPGLAQKLGLGITSESTASPNDNISREPTVSHFSSTSSLAVSSRMKVNARHASVSPVLACTVLSGPDAPLVRRVDNSATLIAVSLKLAKLEAVEDIGKSNASPLAHQAKIANPVGVASRTHITKADCLLGDNVIVAERCVIKECVIGANCIIKAGARLTKCVIMDGATVGENCKITGSIVGRRARIGQDAELTDCEIQDGYDVSVGIVEKNERLMTFQALEDGDELDAEDNNLLE